MKYILFISIISFFYSAAAQQNVPEPVEEERERNVTPTMNSNRVEPVMIEELSKKAKASKITSAQGYSASSEAELMQQRYVNANASFQQSYSTSKKLSSRKSPTIEELKEMNSRLQEMRETNANGFEYQLAEYQIGNHDISKIEFLREAERLNPSSKDVQLQLAAYYEITGSSQKKEYLKKLNKSKYFSQDLLNYARLVLSTLPEKSILVTHGINDTYPIWIEQSLNAYRADVRIVSLDLMQSEEYRAQLKKEGFRLPTSSFVDAKYLQEFVQLNSAKSICVSMTLPTPYLKSLQSYLEIEGLSFTIKSSDPAARNQQIYQQLLSELDRAHKPSTSLGKQLQLNLVPMLLVVRNTAQLTKDKRLLQKVEKQLMEIAESADKEKQIKSLMK